MDYVGELEELVLPIIEFLQKDDNPVVEITIDLEGARVTEEYVNATFKE